MQIQTNRRNYKQSRTILEMHINFVSELSVSPS